MAAPATPDEGAARLRVDKWLWQARFVRSRGLAAELAGSGRLRVNGMHCTKPAQPIRPGDVLTFPQGGRIRVIRIEALGTRRGPATEAATLYTDLDPPAASPAGDEATDAAQGQRDRGAGRPSKRERREIDMLRRDRP
ncbi:RNA-binding S4 domain-containing protein [Limibaculum sp. FT325]|uniref:RNA-binding S4 domain-containing protein n=1 Tax=Thermohalobaculum sediminis TaxID=2939436 RepID=UPI0020BE203C|nr:RNA-binding S4 domain-containing protein [Limibaculum sediminis]MCL5775791.1 RNA-binding S4 domain-containing protein [Limibaculum sediminis]